MARLLGIGTPTACFLSAMPRATRTAVLGQSRPTGAICVRMEHPPPSIGIGIATLRANVIT